MEEPYRRSSIGVDTNDHALDVVVAPDLTWTWKDAEELQGRVESGVYFAEFVERVRAEGEQAIADLEARRPPFSGEWVEWRPDPAWGLPALPEGWDTATPVLWPERHLAYADMAAQRS